jgi:hypothetical protein
MGAGGEHRPKKGVCLQLRFAPLEEQFNVDGLGFKGNMPRSGFERESWKLLNWKNYGCESCN